EINHIYNAQYLTARNLSNIRQGSAGMYGYGFANPTQDFVDAFEPGDPRLWETVYADGQVLPDGKIADVGNSETGYMNKKAYLMESEDRKASCRERGESSGEGGGIKKKRKGAHR